MSSIASPTQEIVVSKPKTTNPSATIPPSSSNDKTLVQETKVSLEELSSFSPKHDNLVLNISDPIYIRRLMALMNAQRERRLLDGIGNILILSTGLVFQQLDGVQIMEDELRDAWNALERLMQEKDQVSTALEKRES